MNCDAVRRRLLSLERPEAPPADLRNHLAACPTCRLSHEQLVQLERDVLALAVPPPQRRSAFLEELAEAAPPRLLPIPPSLSRPPARFRRERGLQKMAIAVALAASLLVVAIIAALWTREPPSPYHPGPQADVRTPLQKRLDADARWQQARTADDRVRLLDEIAGEVEGEVLAQARVNSTAGLQARVELYREVIDRLTETEAPQLAGAVEDRKKVLGPIAVRLVEVNSEANRLAMDHPEAAHSLHELAFVAVEGNKKLRALL